MQQQQSAARARRALLRNHLNSSFSCCIVQCLVECAGAGFRFERSVKLPRHYANFATFADAQAGSGILYEYAEYA